MTYRVLILIFSQFFLFGNGMRENNERNQFFPKIELKPENAPNKENVWVFILAGQSNMAGRGLVEPQDTLPNKRIFSVNKDGALIIAKEPLHFYEPSMTGLDCGLSFGNEILKHIPDSISILLIPTAVGGSSISQWINNLTFRDVPLFSNFSDKVKIGQKYGTIKGILWHQGESDAKMRETIELYQIQLKKLFEKFRIEIDNLSLPILLGELGYFSENYDCWQAVNKQIQAYVKSDTNSSVIPTQDLKDIGDRVHFNSEGQRLMGQRFAMEFVKRQKIVSP